METVLTQDRAVQTAQSDLLTRASVTLVAASVLAVSAAYYAQNLTALPSVKIGLQDFAWMGRIQLGLDRHELTGTDGVLISEVQVPTRIDRLVAPPRPTALGEWKRAPRTIHKNVGAKRAVAATGNASHPGISVTASPVRNAQTSGQLGLHREDLAEAQTVVQNVPVSRGGTSEEMLLQTIHAQLRNQFFLALNTQNPEQLDTQSVIAESGGSNLPSPAQPASLHAWVASSDSSRDQHSSVQASITQPKKFSPASSVAKQKHPAQVMPRKLEVASVGAQVKVQLPKSSDSDTSQIIEIRKEDAQVFLSDLAQVLEETTAKHDYSGVNTQNAVAVSAVKGEKLASNDGSAAELYGPPLPPGFDLQGSRVLAASEVMGPQPSSEAEAVASSEEAPDKEIAPFVGVEAFDWDTEITDFDTQVLSHEGLTDGAQGKWIVASARGRFPLVRWAPARSRRLKLPFISENTLFSLEQIANTQLRDDSAVVFGWLPNGYSVEFSGHADSVLYFDGDNRFVDPTDAEARVTRKYFVLLNVQPGAHFLTLISPSGQESGAMALPVYANHTTFADLTHTTYRTVNGRVLDASATRPVGRAGLRVQVLGSGGAEAETRENGTFTIHRVKTFDDLPLYVEVQSESGYTHRYRAKSGSEGHLQLFYLSPDQVQEWLGQLQGSISAESGIILGAAPEVIAAHPGDALFAATESASPQSTLTPETYTLSSGGYLLPESPLQAENPRFFAVQIPNGPNVLKIEDQSQKAVWSQVVYSSPGVVNVISPEN